MSMNDPHLEAMMETEARYEHHADDAPERFRRLQFWVTLAVLAVIVVGSFIFVLTR